MATLRSCLGLAFCIMVIITANAQWQYVGSPETGTPINFDADGDTIFVCTNAGIFYSDDNAISWHRLRIPKEVINPLEAIAENGVLYLIGSDQYYYNKSLLFRSDDFGETWIDISRFSETNGIFINAFVYGDTLLVVRFDTLALSFDRGTTYEIFQSPVNPEKIIYHKNRIIGVDNNAILESFDFGISWDTVYHADSSHLTDVNVIDGVLWKSENLNFNERIEISRSDNDGQTWIPVFYNNLSGLVVPSVVGGDGKYFIADLSSAPHMYFSDNDGLDWIIKEFDESKWKFFYHQGLLLGGDFSRMFRSQDDGESFTSIHDGFEAAAIRGFAKYGDDFWVNANTASFKKSGSGWDVVPGVSNVVSTLDGHMLGYVNSVPGRSSNGGAIWTTIPPDAFGYPYYSTYRSFLSAGNVLYVNGGLESWSSDDGGVEWNERSGALSIIDYNQTYVASEHLFGDVLISDDGIDWQDITFNINPGIFGGVHSIHDHNGTVFVSNRDGLFRLPAFSKIWEQIPGPVMLSPLSNDAPEINIMKSHNNILIAGVNGYGVYISADNGNNWQEANQGLENFHVLSSTIVEGEIYIGVEGGVWKRPLSELIVTDVSELNTLLKISVSPSPVNDFLYITIDDLRVTGVHLTLFDAKGAVIKSEILASSNDLRLDVRSIQSGVYFLRILVDKQWETFKVVKI